MTNQANPHLGSAERRAAVVAGIRKLADLLESDLTLPVPNSVHAQYSLLGDLDDAGRQFIRDVAAHLGIDPAAPQWTESHLVDGDDTASVRYGVASGHTPEEGSYRVGYVVHGMVEPAGGVA